MVFLTNFFIFLSILFVSTSCCFGHFALPVLHGAWPCGAGAARLAAAKCVVSRPRKRQTLPLRGQGLDELVLA
jgi:hypothetical protein